MAVEVVAVGSEYERDIVKGVDTLALMLEMDNG
jgi:hypothetical protein